MRRFCNKAFFTTIRALIFINQIMLLAPIVYNRPAATSNTQRSSIFRTHPILSICAMVTCLLMFLVAPILVQISATTNAVTQVKHDELYAIIERATQMSDIATSLLIFAAQIWYRQHLVKVMNLLVEIVENVREQLEVNFIKLQILLLLWLQLSLALYEFLLLLLFLLWHAKKMYTIQLLAQLATLYVQQLGAIFAADMFAAILLLMACYQQMEISLKCVESMQNNVIVMGKLVQLENSLHRCVELFTQTFQFAIFLVIFRHFINLFTNLYAMLFYYVVTHGLWYTFVAFCIKVSIDLYSLVYVAHRCHAQHQRVKHLFLNRDFELILQPPFSLTHTDPLWPSDIHFRILGMFTLNNEFWSVLVSFSVNFVVIILQFAVENSN